MTVAAVRLDHAVPFVSDLERSLRFWTVAFGMEIAAREPRADAAFPRSPRSGNHHDLGLLGIGAGAAPRQRGTVGLYHLARQVDSIEELEEARRNLADFGALTGESSPGATTSVHGIDPDGNESEVMRMQPREAWGEYENAAPVDRLDMRAEVARRAGVGTAGSVPSPVLGTP